MARPSFVRVRLLAFGAACSVASIVAASCGGPENTTPPGELGNKNGDHEAGAESGDDQTQQEGAPPEGSNDTKPGDDGAQDGLGEVGDDVGADTSEASSGDAADASDTSSVDTGACDAGLTSCANGDAGSHCVNEQTDVENCGKCGTVCAIGGTCTSGQCGCPGSQTVCNNKCVDTTTDNTNCGFCGHNCQGNLCVSGICQPTVIEQSNNLILDIAVDPTHVYWTAGSSNFVAKKAFAGGVAVYLTQAASDPRGIVTDQLNVYWVEYGGGGALGYQALLGSSTTYLVTPPEGGTGTPIDVAVDGTNAYFVDSTGGLIESVPLKGGAVKTIASGQLTPISVAVDSTSVYWANYGSNVSNTGGIFKAPTGGGSVVTLTAGVDKPNDIAVDSANVYWTEKRNGTGGVKQIPIGGGSVTLLAGSANSDAGAGLGGPYGITIDATKVYWTNYNANTVMSVPIGGGQTYTLASSQNNPASMAIDSVNVYWANQGDGTIWKVAK